VKKAGKAANTAGLQFRFLHHRPRNPDLYVIHGCFVPHFSILYHGCVNLKFLQPNTADARHSSCKHQETTDGDTGSVVYVDNELARQAQHGDLAAFEELFTRHHKRVYNIARGILQNDADAADATQEVFVRAYKSIGRLTSAEAFVTWLKTMTINICRDALRKRGKVRLESLDAPMRCEDGESKSREIADWSGDPGGKAVTRDLQESVQKAISSLKPDYREVVTLFYIDGADVAEISRITGSPQGTVKSWLSRARAELKRKLECYVSGE